MPNFKTTKLGLSRLIRQLARYGASHPQVGTHAHFDSNPTMSSQVMIIKRQITRMKCYEKIKDLQLDTHKVIELLIRNSDYWEMSRVTLTQAVTNSHTDV